MTTSATWKLVQSPAGERLVKCLPADEGVPLQRVVCRKAHNNYVVQQTYPPSHRALTEAIIPSVKLSGCHPCHIFTNRMERFDDYSVVTQAEFATCGDLQSYIVKISKKLDQFEHAKNAPTFTSVEADENKKNFLEFRAHQIQFAKSVARQLIEYVAWLQTTPDGVCHGNINPTTILLHRDGCIKMKYFRFFTKDMVRENPFHFWKKCAYAAPEVSASVDARMNSGPRNDIWAIGAVLYSIMKGESFLPEYPPCEPKQNLPKAEQRSRSSSEPGGFTFGVLAEAGEKSPEGMSSTLEDDLRTADDESSPQPVDCREETDERQSEKYDAFMRFVDTASFADWVGVFVDPALAYLAKWCLTKHIHYRPHSCRLLAFMHFAGLGLAQSSYALPVAKFAERRKHLAPIAVPDHAFTKNDKIRSLCQSWSETYDAWSTDVAQLSPTYSHQAVVATVDPLWDGQIDSTITPEVVQEIKSLRSQQFQRCLKLQFSATAEIEPWLRAAGSRTDNAQNAESIELVNVQFFETLCKSKLFDILWNAIETVAIDRNKMLLSQKKDPACVDANERIQFYTAVKGRMTCSMIALQRAMFYVGNNK